VALGADIRAAGAKEAAQTMGTEETTATLAELFPSEANSEPQTASGKNGTSNTQHPTSNIERNLEP
jgi:hypothetical protein